MKTTPLLGQLIIERNNLKELLFSPDEANFKLFLSMKDHYIEKIRLFVYERTFSNIYGEDGRDVDFETYFRKIYNLSQHFNAERLSNGYTDVDEQGIEYLRIRYGYRQVCLGWEDSNGQYFSASHDDLHIEPAFRTHFVGLYTIFIYWKL